MRTRPTLTALCLCLAAAAAGTMTGSASAQTVNPPVVISQVYGGGGNTGGLFKNDFIEIFNRSDAPVDITGWSVQYASTAGTTWQKTDLTGVLQPGQYYLIQEAVGAGTSQPALPTPDATGTINMSANNGKVALVNNNTLIASGTSCPTNNASVIDFVGFGTANCFEGAGATPALGNSTASVRNNNGCTDTNNNAADFSVLAPTPRNTASPLNICGPSTPPSGAGAANPNPACRNSSVVLAVTVTRGANPVSNITSVVGDTTSIGGAAGVSLLDDGVAPDAVANDGIYTASVTVGGAAPFANLSVPVVITDALGRAGNASVAVTVANCDPRGFGAANPGGNCAGSSSLITVSAVGGLNPPSTGLQALVDLSPIGLSSAQQLFDDGTNGDVTAGDNVFSYLAAIPAATPVGPYTFGGVVLDDQNRAGLVGNFTLNVVTCVDSGAQVVISQVYGGGGNAGATLKNDFVELFNRGDAAVVLDGMSLQYSASSGATGFSNRVDLVGTIQPKKYFLIQLAPGAGGTVDLPTPDQDASAGQTIFAGATAGRFALVMATSNVGLNCATAPNILDLVGYGGGAACFEGLATVGSLSNTTAALRVNGGCQDFNQNVADFTIGEPNPRNSSAPANTCGGPAFCSTDVNQDGATDPDDLSDAISCFFDANCSFDYDHSGFEDPDDLSTYISDFFTPNFCG